MDLEIKRCPHCGTHVLLMDDGKCPNCRKAFDAPVDEKAIGARLGQKARSARRRKIAVVFGAIVAAVGITYLYLLISGAHRETLERRRQVAEEAALDRQFMEAYHLKDWSSVVKHGEKRRHSERWFDAAGWMLAEGYFHSGQYASAVDTMKRFIEHCEDQDLAAKGISRVGNIVVSSKGPTRAPDSGPQTQVELLWSFYEELAKYLSFTLTESGDDPREGEIEGLIWKVYASHRDTRTTPLEQYRAFGAIKYRIDTREPITDADWEAKYWHTSPGEWISGRLLQYVAIWVEAIRTRDLDRMRQYAKLSQPWKEGPIKEQLSDYEKRN